MLKTFLIPTIFLAACSDASLSGSSGLAKKNEVKEAEPPPAAEPPAEGTPAPPPPGSEAVGDTEQNADTPEPGASEAGAPAKAIAECLKAWEDHPFTAAELAKPTTVTVDQVNNNNAVSYRDADETAKPTLILVNVTSKNINLGVIELLNPKGWYCIDVQSKAANNFTIKLACDSHVATLSHTEHVANGFAVERPGC